MGEAVDKVVRLTRHDQVSLSLNELLVALPTLATTIVAGRAYLRESTRVGKLAEAQKKRARLLADEQLRIEQAALASVPERQRTNEQQNNLNALTAELRRRSLGPIRVGGYEKTTKTGKLVHVGGYVRSGT